MTGTSDRKRILFVDDEPFILSSLRRLLKRMRPAWEVEFAGGGEEALAMVEAGSLDVIVSDMRMPGMDGAEVLSRIAKTHPGVVRIVLSGQSDTTMTLQTVASAHQFLAKPFEAPALVELLDRACNLRDLLEDPTMHELAGGVSTLPSAPSTYRALSACLSGPSASLEDVVRIMERDVAMSAKVLQMVNSAFFGLPQQTTSIGAAVGLLGFQTIQALALTAGAFSSLESFESIPGFSLEVEQQHALQVGRVATLVARDLGGDADDAFTAGLLHDVGKVLLAMRRPALLAAAFETARTERRPLFEVESELSLSHAKIGGYLLGIWGLPLDLVEAVAYHHAPGQLPQAGLGTVAAVHIANALVRGLGLPDWDVENSASPWLDMEYLEQRNLTNRIPEWRLEISGG